MDLAKASGAGTEDDRRSCAVNEPAFMPDQCAVGVPVVCGDEPEGFNRSISLLCCVLIPGVGLKAAGRLDISADRTGPLARAGYL